MKMLKCLFLLATVVEVLTLHKVYAIDMLVRGG